MIGLQECGPAPPRAPVSGSRARERRAQAVDYYNTHVHKAWANAGLSTTTTTTTSRSSFNDRHHHHHHSTPRRPQHLPPEQLYRSNSSLELLDHNGRPSNTNSPTLLKQREYGSHGSIDVIDRPPGPLSATTSESFFAMLQDYRPAVLGAIGTDQRSPGPSEYLRGKIDTSSSSSSTLVADTSSSGIGDDIDANHHQHFTPQSPKLRMKLQRFWGSGSVNGGRHTMDDSVVSSSSSSCSVVLSAESEEIARRRAFSHYDCQSLTTNLNYAVRLRRLLAKRRNTTTGASAASMLARSTTPDGASGSGSGGVGGVASAGDSGDEDSGDGQTNELVQSCPFFRNEIGGEEERVVSLTRLQNGQQTANSRKALHRPPLAYGVAVLEFPPGETHWRHSTCPYQRLPRPIESVDQGALYYRNYFLGQDHQNWFGMDEQLGPVAISIRREKVIHSDNQSSSSIMQHQYRLVIRTSELQTLRGAVLEDAIPNIKASSNSKTLNMKDVLDYVAPEIQQTSLRLGLQNQQTEEQLLKLDEQGLTNNYKVGVMYCKAGQSSEEEMYNNEEAGPAFIEFLETIGKKVRLSGFSKYKAGLDNKSDSTGLYSVYSQYQDCEVMFHVSTMLPFTPNNRQQLLRKRHIGNDIVTIVFQEPGALPFTPKGLRSHFQHVFIVVQAINPCTENTHYKVAVSRSKDVQVFGPPIKDGAIFPKGKTFAEFLLAKVVNAENAAHCSEKFVTMATRTRQEYLKDLVANCSSSTPVDTGQKFSIFSSKKKDKIRPRFIPDACQRGAILWQVWLDDSSQSQQIKCFLGISTDTLVLIEETTRQIVFVTPCKSILGWSSQTNGLRIYHHQGECMTIHMRDAPADRDELLEIMERLKSVTQGVPAQELPLKRNIMGQLGFHVQPDGIVTLVESAGQAWQAGLRQNSRLVEICKVAVSTLTYDQMVDLLKTSLLVTLTVIPPLLDGSPRKGCTLQNCKYNEGNYEGDYENLVTNEDGGSNKSRKAPQMQQAVPGNHRRVYERSFSPPRSSNSSGYGTGSSSKSFHGQDIRFQVNAEGGTMTSSSSGHSSDEKWYEILQELEPPPPVPIKNSQLSSSNRTNNTFPTTPKRNNNTNNNSNNNTSSNNNSHQIHHNHFINNNSTNNNNSQQPSSVIHHNKIQVSHSLPLQHVNYSQPLTAALHHTGNNNLNDYELSFNNLFKQQQHNDRSLVNNNNRQQQQQQSDHGSGGGNNSDYLITRAPKVAEYSVPLLNNDFNRMPMLLNNNNNDNHSTDSSSISERLYGIGGSEDELSNGSGGGVNMSPRTRRAAATANKLYTNNHNNNNNSRNQSPRSMNNGEAKLRPGVTNARSSNRNSANLSSASSSNFQEELLRLINPDNIEASSSSLLSSVDNTTSKETTISQSRENLNSINNKNQQQQAIEVILTMARPATVISNASTTSSPLPTEFIINNSCNNNNNKFTTKDANKSNNNKSSTATSTSSAVVTPEEFPLPDGVDWPSLVDTATRVIMQGSGGGCVSSSANATGGGGSAVSETFNGADDNRNNRHWDDDGPIDASITSSISSSTNVSELQSHITELQSKLNRETRRRLSQETEVRRLNDENRVLQDQAQAAVQQLRKFTEWFFRNVQRQ